MSGSANKNEIQILVKTKSAEFIKRKLTLMENNNQEQSEPKFYRFQVFQANRNAAGKLEKTKTIGMTYHKPGEQNYTMRLWTFVDERFYILPNHNQSGRYFVMTREANKNPNVKNKYYWNIVGSGQVDSANGVIELEMDLFDKKIFMNIFPEAQAKTISFADFEENAIAA